KFYTLMLDRRMVVKRVELIYVLAFPLLFLGWITSKSFTLYNLRGYYSALTAPIAAWLFWRLSARCRSYAGEVVKISLVMVSMLWGMVRLLEYIPLQKGSLVDEETWHVVLASPHLDNLVALGVILLPLILPRRKEPSTYSIGAGSKCIVAGGTFLYLALAILHYVCDYQKEASLWLGSSVWYLLGSLLGMVFSWKVDHYIGEIYQKSEDKIGCILDVYLYGRLLAIFIVVLLLTNVVLVRYIKLFGLDVTASLLVYPFTFLLTDLISELYGYHHAKGAVISGLVASIWMGLWVYVLVRLPGDPVIDRCFTLFFTFAPGIILGSMVAYLTAQWLDVHLFDTLKERTQGRYLWLRNNVGTILSQLVDTLVFGLVAWEVWPRLGSAMHVSGIQWSHVVINEYFFKVIMALLDTPFLYFSLYLVRKFAKKSPKKL
ncbi:MAG: queuosine precursor transporter, partial [Bacteroidota bacterium]